ncbi:hypothetical protein PR048_013385 [Dryococelus australis]|uniref:Uncharacterized protein n=1 Tax=Dryococelus australis TaxID=614101 RepID=A0ABQ9HST9_9NEOP|nr:hypothetical protein PR048_013385 [Dryococelus australis]
MAPSFKVSKECVMIMVAANAASTHSLPLLMMDLPGNSRNARIVANGNDPGFQMLGDDEFLSSVQDQEEPGRDDEEYNGDINAC